MKLSHLLVLGSIISIIDTVLNTCQVFTNPTSFYVADMDKVFSNIVVTAPAGEVIKKVSIIDFKAYHTCVSDIDITLTSPHGDPQGVKFLDNQGSCGNTFIDWKFDPSSSTGFDSGPYDGSKVYTAGFNAFNGEDPNGEWKLYFDDNVGADCGTLCFWALQISTGAAGSTDVIDCSNATYTPKKCSPKITTATECEDIQAAFANGGGFGALQSNKQVMIQDSKNSNYGTHFLYHWVNYADNTFNSNDGQLSINNRVKYFYEIKDDITGPSNLFSRSLQKRYYEFVINADGTSPLGKYFVAWDITEENTNNSFCDCSSSGNGYVGNGTFKALIKFSGCLDTNTKFFEKIGALNDVAIVKYDDQGLSAHLIGSTNFNTEDDLIQVFKGQMTASSYGRCATTCTIR